MRTAGSALGRLAACGALAGLLVACGGGGSDGGAGDEDGCPDGAPSVAIGSFRPDPEPTSPGVYRVRIGFEVTNDGREDVEVRFFDLPIAGVPRLIDLSAEPGPVPVVPAGETVTIEGTTLVGTPSPDMPEPSPSDIHVDWDWDGTWGTCPSPDVTVPPSPGGSTTTLPEPPPGPPEPPPGALPLGEAATFTLAGGAEVRVAVTAAEHGGTCPAPDAPPAQNGEYLFLTVRLEVGPGVDGGWVLDPSDFDIGGAAIVNSMSSNAGLCTGPTPANNTVVAGAGRSAEGVIVFDVAPVTSVTFEFEAHQAESGTATWAI
jgi:hypothetical protein